MTGNPDRWSAYAGALLRIEAPGGVLWMRPAPVTWTRGTYPDPEGRVICVITAHNPGGQTVSEGENARQQRRLERELTRRGWTWWRAAGGDPSWEHVEASAAVVGVGEAEVVTLGAKFGQDAIFVLTPAGRRIVGCLTARELSTGWSVSGREGPLRVINSGASTLEPLSARRRLSKRKPKYVALGYAWGHWPKSYDDLPLAERIELASHKPLDAYVAKRTSRGWRWVPYEGRIGPKMALVAEYAP